MKTAVRFYSRSGNTKLLADALARGAGVEAVSTDAESAPLTEPVDLLLIGGALYAYGIDAHLKSYLATLTKEQVGRAVIFSTSWISKHAITLIRKALTEKGIPVAEEFCYVRGKPKEKDLLAAEAFAKKLSD